ncbi:VOC family protein [Pelomonas sp. CA6]|uniref:VOC family protein n=1 Tax=Pelomonas sp. CA6 TaxID=2907999 RepID=UPI001F4BF1B7|nr:VOC family protein [Pelomonas sp. CA6]MCH7343147.1 VOC family protein [Pelomonas sp. CA6]
MTLARAVGINHVSLEVGDIAAAVDFYTALLEVEVDDLSEDRCSLELGDQFIALTRGREQGRDGERHFGLVVDDKERLRARLIELGIPLLPGRFLGFLDPWGNHVEIVGYANIRFAKTPAVLEDMGLSALRKNPPAAAS